MIFVLLILAVLLCACGKDLPEGANPVRSHSRTARLKIGVGKKRSYPAAEFLNLLCIFSDCIYEAGFKNKRKAR